MFLELTPGQFINLAEVLDLRVDDEQLVVTYRGTGWIQTYPLVHAPRERVLATLRDMGRPQAVIMDSTPLAWQQRTRTR